MVKDALADGVRRLGLVIDNSRLDLLVEYVALIRKWNRVFNLVARDDVAYLVSHHLLDSLSIAHHLEGIDWVDVGSGAGLPGIPLSCLFPDKRFTLIDSNGKRTRFLTQVTIELGLDNVEVLQARAEEVGSREFDGATVRAFSSLVEIERIICPLVKVNGVVLAMKADLPQDELKSLSGSQDAELISLSVPGLDAMRQLVKLKVNR